MKWMFLKILQLKTAKGEECLCHLRGELDYFVDTEKQEDFFLLFFFFFFFFWAHDQLAKPFATVFESIYIQTLVSFISTENV